MAEFIYTMRKVRKAHGDKVILDDVTLNFLPGAKIGVVGPNGAGKSSVLRIMAGLDQANNGDAMLAPGSTVGILMQEPQLDESKTVRENVEDGVAVKAKLNRYNEVAELMATDYTDELMEEMGHLQEELDAAEAWDIDSQLEQAMDALRCPPADEPVTHLSGGERRRVALCKLLLSKPDLLLLDEPTNHLDAESVLWLEQYLAKYPGTIIAITHDRYFLDNVANWILELDRQKYYPWKGNYSGWLEQKAERLRLEEKADKTREKTLEREFEWIKQSPKARQAKSKARIANYERMAAKMWQVSMQTPRRSGSSTPLMMNARCSNWQPRQEPCPAVASSQSCVFTPGVRRCVSLRPWTMRPRASSSLAPTAAPGCMTMPSRPNASARSTSSTRASTDFCQSASSALPMLMR